MPDDDTLQADGQPADDQPAEQSEEQPADSDQSPEQSEDQPAESDHPVTSGTADDTLAFADDTASPAGGDGGAGGGPADDAVAADSRSGSKRNLKVVAEFTQEGN